ncbi:hypothetical protein ABTQ33_00820 [Paucilactobacillus suebicus]|uniref:Uncharacterized protein n=1 Tax=Paucilactobacillus suebicus DSM 5007 = KCTC 3549 TaxID=1423807 RepID=A0A0R1W8U2_9LACO|nr:hypothetical protein [Paucilactobacillus suebicus]KRM11977.1 hypothetical protein FD16_GL000345 [Paucilactobacillus suebicus DSM 5007 = KCTC 3549]
MTIELKVSMSETKTKVELPDEQGTLIFSSKPIEIPDHGIQLFINESYLVSVDDEPKKYDEVLTIQLPWSIEPKLVGRVMQNRIGETEIKVPQSQIKAMQSYLDMLTKTTARLGVVLSKKAVAKKDPAKPRHKFYKDMVNMPFKVNRNGSEATVFWTASKEMTVKAGAKLTGEKIMNKDGSMRYGTKYGEKLRADHADAIDGLVTTKDVKLRSVNEVGLFLYYGDTNGRLELINEYGQTLNELTIVK